MILRRELIARVLRSQSAEWRHPPAARPYVSGHSYQMKVSQTGRVIARALVVDVNEQLLHEVTDEQALRSGFASAYELWEWWLETHHEGWGHRRPMARPVPVRVEVVLLKLDTSPELRLLARRSEYGYTDKPSLALPGEPEAPPERDVELFALDARDRDSTRQAEELAAWRELPLDQRLRDALASARRRGIDCSRDLRLIEQRLERIKRRALGAAT